MADSERFGLDVPPQERRPTPWYAPMGLRNVAQQQLWSMNLLRNLDRRETFTGPLSLIDLSQVEAEPQAPFWFDFVADTGDGGAASYAVARGVLTPQLQASAGPGDVVTAASETLPEGRLLIFGGDLAYPGASPELYQSRFVEMFELARDRRSRFKEVPLNLAANAALSPDHKLVAAIPQNHDWFDSASTFCRYFVNDQKAGLIGARAPQQQTYFAFALPHDWYVLGFDFALTGDLDRHQFEAFRALIVSGRIPAGAHLVLIYPEPYWTRPVADQIRSAYPRRFQRLENEMLQAGLNIRLRLAGDLHHYARERLPQAPPGGLSSDLVTCGTGGAFGHSTHGREVTEPKVMQWASELSAAQAELQGRLVVGRVASAQEAAELGLCFGPARLECAPQAPETAALHSEATYPSQSLSRQQAWGNLTALLRPRGEPVWQSNMGFALLIGVLCLAVAWSCRGLTGGLSGFAGGALALVLLESPWAWFGAVGLGITGLFIASDNDPGAAGRADKLWAAALGLSWIGGSVALGLGLLAPWWQHLQPHLQPYLQEGGSASPSGWGGALHQALCLGTVYVACWGLAAVVGGVFLTALSLCGRAVTNVSSALSLQNHKGFLRFRVTPQGLDVWMLGCDRVPQQWEPVPAAKADTRPYWQPAPGEPALHWRVVDRFTLAQKAAAAGDTSPP